MFISLPSNQSSLDRHDFTDKRHIIRITRGQSIPYGQFIIMESISSNG